MQVQMNTTQQSNPSFGHFRFTERALKHFQQTLKPKQLDRFEKIINAEAVNKTVEASIDYNGSLSAYLRTMDKTGNPISDFCKDLGSQGFLSRLIHGELGYLAGVSRASDEMESRFLTAKQVEEDVLNAIAKANK